MRKFVVVLVVVLLLAVPASVAAAQTTLSVEEALSDNSDSDTLSYTFVVSTTNDTTITIPSSQTSQSAAGGDISLDFEQWEEVGSARSGTGRSWDASDGEQYRVVYEASTSTNVDDADEGTYQFDVEPEDDDGTTYDETFSVTFDFLSPQFGGTDSERGEIEFSGGSTAGTRVTAEFDNDGDGVLVPESVSYSGVPSGIAVSTKSLDNRVSTSGQGTFDISIDADESVSVGTHTFTATVEDNLGNTVDIPVEVEVYKPPSISVNNGGDIELGKILRGERGSTTVEVSEVTGYGPVDDLSVTARGREVDADISVSGLDGTYISASGSVTGDIVVDVGQNADQHQDLFWDIGFQPDNPRSNRETATVTAEVIYRPYFDDISAENTRLIYDEPRDQTTSFRKERTVEVRNGGDLEMDVTTIETSTDSGVSVKVLDAPSTIPPLSTGTIDIAVAGDSDTGEGLYSYSVSVTGDQAEYRGTDSATTEASGEIEVVHETEVVVDPKTVGFGEIPITEERRRSIDIRERLGYQDVDNFSIEQVDGPNTWLKRVDGPDSLSAGEQESLIVGVTFDANATLYKEYTWQFQINGDNIEAEPMTVTATPRPVQCTAVIERLEEYDGSDKSDQMASKMVAGVRALEERLRENPEQGPIRDLSKACTVSRSALLFLNADKTSQSLIEAGNHTGAQPYVVRMAAGFNTMTEYAGRIETEEARRPMESGMNVAQSLLEDRVKSQVNHYDESLSEDDPALEQAEAYRELAQLAALEGDEQRAQKFQSQAETAFEEYRSNVTKGTAALQRARDTRDELDESLFVSAFGARVFWIGSFDRFDSQTQAVLSDYQTAHVRFEEAGATSRAQEAAEERRQMASAYNTAFLASAALGGLVGLLFLVAVIYEILSVYRYIQDSQAAVSGDFLL